MNVSAVATAVVTELSWKDIVQNNLKWNGYLHGNSIYLVIIG